MRGREPKIQVDIDCDRVREIVSEALRMIYEYVGGEFLITREQVMEKLNRILDSQRITTQFFLELGSKRMTDLELRVDPVRREVLCKSVFKKKVIEINRFLRILG